MVQYRQGDVAFEKVDELPQVKKLNTNVVAVGESQNHAHVMSDNAELFEDKDGVLYVKAPKNSVLRHVNTGTDTKAEHDEIAIEEGYYRVIIQREFDPYAKAIRRAGD